MADTTQAARYAVITLVDADMGWMVAYVGPDLTVANRIADRERARGREAHVLTTTGAGEA